MKVKVQHRTTGSTKSFDNVESVHAFMLRARTIAKKDKKQLEEIQVFVDDIPVSRDIFDVHVPIFVAQLILELEQRYQASVPKWHFMQKKHRYSSGTTYHLRSSLEVTHIAVSMGTDEEGLKGLIIHEYSHALTVGESHGYNFYKKMFEICEAMLPMDTINKVLEVEFRYKKNSRYWYQQIYNSQLSIVDTVVGIHKKSDMYNLFELEDN